MGGPGWVFEMTTHEEFDPIAVQKEAAMFYGLFLRGHSPDKLRADIEIPVNMLEKWMTREAYGDDFRHAVRRIYTFRKQVLAVFDELVDREKLRVRLQ
jgi:hypothetical protein